MTTIAIADGVVAVDTQGTDHNTVLRIRKVYRLPDGGVAVGCGLWSAAYAGISWLMNGERGEPPDIDGAEVIAVRADHSIWIADARWPMFPILDTHYTAGCGRDYARQLLSQGKDPVQAVAEACQLDLLSSGPVLSMTVCAPMDTDPQTYTVGVTKRKRASR